MAEKTLYQDAIDKAAASAGIWGAYNPEAAQRKADTPIERNPNASLDKNAFLLLLVTQMQYQDPLNPVDDKQFLAQMAQFTALEQMQNMNATTSKSQAYSMIGKEIYAEIYNSETYSVEQVEGYVTAVSMKNNVPYLLVMTDSGALKTVALDDVSEVYDTASGATQSIAEQMRALQDSMAISQNMGLIGKYVQAISKNANGEPIYVEGVVDSVKFHNGQAVMVVGDKEIFGNEVVSVADGWQLLKSHVSVYENDGDGYAQTLEGAITNVKFIGDDVFAVIGGSDVKLSSVNDLVYLTEAQKYLSKQTEYGGEAATITGVAIRDAKVFVVVTTAGGETGLVDFSAVRGLL